MAALIPDENDSYRINFFLPSAIGNRLSFGTSSATLNWWSLIKGKWERDIWKKPSNRWDSNLRPPDQKVSALSAVPLPRPIFLQVQSSEAKRLFLVHEVATLTAHWAIRAIVLFSPKGNSCLTAITEEWNRKASTSLFDISKKIKKSKY